MNAQLRHAIGIICMIACFTAAAPLAQAGSGSLSAKVSDSIDDEGTGPNMLSFDFIPAYGHKLGFGLNYQRRLGSYFSAGPFVIQSHRRPWFQLWEEVSYSVLRYGFEVRAKLYPYDVTGPYVAVGIQKVEAKGSGRVNGFLTEGSVDVESNKLEKVAYKAQVGVFLQGMQRSFGRFFVDLALSFGPADYVEYTTGSSGKLGEKTETGYMKLKDIPDRTWIVAALGLSF